MSFIQKVEIVRPAEKDQSWPFEAITNYSILALRVLIVWWFFAAWFPQFGLTYWQLVLPVYAVRSLLSERPLARYIPSKKLQRWEDGTAIELTRDKK